MKRRLCLVPILLIFSLILCGCLPTDKETGNKRASVVVSEPERDTGILYSGAQSGEDAHSNIDLYYDVSMSMRGYMLPEYSRFSKVMEGIFTTAQTIANQEGQLKINTFQFGDTFRKLEDVSILNSWEGYNDLTSNIDLAINNADLNNLSVIVTDMDIEEQSLDTMINKIGSDYISKGYTIGIIGVKSEYTGYVYDLEDKEDRIVLLNTKRKPENTFPFYLLVLGKQGDITEFYDSLKKFILNDFPEGTTNFSLIPLATKGIVASVNDQNITFDYLNETASQMFNETSLIDNSKAKQYKLNREPKSEIGFKLTGLELTNIRYIPTVVRQLYSECQVLSYDESAGTWAVDEKSEDILESKDQSSGEAINLDMLIHSDQMEKGKIYAVQVQSYMKLGGEDSEILFEVPEWVKDWTLDKSKISAWKKEYEKFYKKYGKVASEKVAVKYDTWLKDNKIKSCVNLAATADLDRFYKKITYYVENSKDIKIYSYIYYIQRQY